MKGNYRTLTNLAEEIERQDSVKEDYLVDTNLMMMDGDCDLIVPQANILNSRITNYCHGQIANNLKIPKKYYDAMGEIPGLRSQNVNAWFKNKPQKRLLRTLENKSRAFLSDRYRPMDNMFLMSALLPTIKNFNVEVKSCSMSDTRMYLQLVFPELKGEVKVGDIVQGGITVVNSEVGAGAVDVQRLIWRLACANGMRQASLLRKYHVGARLSDENMDIFENDTIIAELESLKLRLRDTIAHALEPKTFEESLLKMRIAQEDKIDMIQGTIENVTQRFNFSEKETDLIITNMMDESNITRYGLANGITHLAHTIDNPDRQYDYESIGNQIIELKPHEWKIINAA